MNKEEMNELVDNSMALVLDMTVGVITRFLPSQPLNQRVLLDLTMTL